MKIEMGESLFYSWLRHVKSCQVVQTNWKVSPQWELCYEEKLQKFMSDTDDFFNEKYGYNIYKKNRSLLQLLGQGECDVLGLAFQEDNSLNIYAVDVAFHEAGLNYGTHDETIMRVIKKCLRTAMCLWGYLNAQTAEIVFASPKINPAEMKSLIQCAGEMNAIFTKNNLNYHVRILANEDFETIVLNPILMVSKNISDTSELFLRSYQMYQMFARKSTTRLAKKCNISTNQPISKTEFNEASVAFQELKIGKLANTVLRNVLESAKVLPDEIEFMQTKEYSKQFFGLNFSLLAREDTPFDTIRYYRQPLSIYGKTYYLCSQWFEASRPQVTRWLLEHSEEELK